MEGRVSRRCHDDESPRGQQLVDVDEALIGDLTYMVADFITDLCSAEEDD